MAFHQLSNSQVFANFQFPPPSATANLAMAVMNERIVGDNVGCQVVGWNTSKCLNREMVVSPV